MRFVSRPSNSPSFSILLAMWPIADGAMMRRAGLGPFVHELLRADAETVAAVRVADLQHRAGHRFAFRHEQRKFSARALHHREQRHRPVLHGHLDRKALARFAVIDRQRHQPDAALGNREMRRAVVAEEHHVVLQSRTDKTPRTSRPRRTNP